MLLLSVLRSIRKSFARYLAIFSIMALGVGFFAGLRVTRDAMLQTTDKYITETKLYDMKLISTLGFTDDDVAAFAASDATDTARGSFSADVIIVKSSGSDAVVHAHTLLDGINLPDVISGRLPEKSDECIVDANCMDETAIGTRLILSPDNSEETLASFAYREYTVVGIADSPEYMNLERGTTSIGSGSVMGFVYIPADGFVTDYYTEIFLKLNTVGGIYSDEYNASVDSLKAVIEPLLESRAEIRYQAIYSEAADKISDAQASLDEKKAELDGSEKEYLTALSEYSEQKEKAQALLDETKSSLDSSRVELEAAKAVLAEKLASPEAQIPEVFELLEAQRLQLEVSEALLDNGLAEYEKALDDFTAEFEKAKAELDSAGEAISQAKLDIEAAQAEIDSSSLKLNDIKRATVFALDRSSNAGYACFESDTAIVSGVAKVFPLFFLLVAALVCITTITRMVSEQRTENGVLKALGFSYASIISQYLIYSGSASVLGCIAGFFIGSRLMPMALWQVYSILYSIERPIAYVRDFALLGWCLGLFLLCAVAVTLAICGKNLKESAAQLMRPAAPPAGKRVFLEKINFIWKRISFLRKVSIRNILRYKKRMFMMIMGIGGCTALLLTGFGIRDSIQPIVDYQFDEINLYDCTVSFVTPIDADKKAAFSSECASFAENIAFAYTKSVSLIANGTSRDINCVAFHDDLDGFVDWHSGKDAIDTPKVGEAVISNRFSENNSIYEGDRVRLYIEDIGELEVTVSGVFDNYFYDYIYINEETFNDALGFVPLANSAFVNFMDGADEYEAGAKILGAEDVAAVSLTVDLKTRVRGMLDSLDYIVLIVLVCAGALAFIVLYNLTNITITERAREIATLKVLGFYLFEQNAYVFRENIILTAVSAICGIPMGVALLYYVMDQIKINAVFFVPRLTPLSFAWSILLTFIFTFAVDLLLRIKTKRINMAEAMKAVE